MSNKAQTKFPALAIGQRFVWRGRSFVKTGPLLARADDDGRSQMIPRSAVVAVTDAIAETIQPTPEALREAVDALQRTALEQIDALTAEATPQHAKRARDRIRAAYRRVLSVLDDERTADTAGD